MQSPSHGKRKIRVLVVDDSPFFVQILGRVFEKIQGAEVCASASNGQECLEFLQKCSVDLVTLDLEMPGISGIDVIKEVKKLPKPPNIVLISSASPSAMEESMKALHMGAQDWIQKPKTSSLEESYLFLEKKLSPLVQALIQKDHLNDFSFHPETNHSQRKKILRQCQCILIGSSTGGPRVLKKILSELPKDFSLPIIIIQHMSSAAMPSFAKTLNNYASLPVILASEQLPIEEGKIYLAPGKMQSEMKKKKQSLYFHVYPGELIRHCRPCIDLFFSSAAKLLPSQTLAFILTGMGDDGSIGMGEIKNAGSWTVAQDPNSCVVFGMPQAAIKKQATCEIASIENIQKLLIEVHKVSHERNSSR